MQTLFRQITLLITAGSLMLGLVSCAIIGRNAKIVGKDFKDFTGLGGDEEKKEQKGLKSLADVKPTVTADTSQLYSEDKIVWADEDPDKPMFELEKIWEQGPKDNWYLSYSEAMRTARKEGKPVLLWFTNSKSNIASNSLDKELFSKAKFEDWADDNVIRLRIDSNIMDDDVRRRGKKQDYVNKLRKQYKVLGSPVVLIASPRGTHFGKYRGYKSGNAAFYFGRLKSAHRNAMADYANWRQEYEAKGYRVWHDNRGRKQFAKPVGLKNGIIKLKNPEGARSSWPVQKLSSEDQTWVAEYVKKHAQR